MYVQIVMLGRYPDGSSASDDRVRVVVMQDFE